MEPLLLKQLALASVPPGLAGLIIYAIVDRLVARPALATMAAGFGMAITYVAVHATLLGGFHVPPAGSADWLPLLSLLGAVSIPFLRTSLPGGGRSRIDWLVPSVMLFAAYVGARHFIRGAWSVQESILHLGGFVAVAWLAHAHTRRSFDENPGALAPAAVAMSAAGLANIMVLGFYSLRLAQGAGVVCAFFVGALIVRAFRRDGAVRGGVVLAPLLLLYTILFLGLIASDVRFGVWMALLGAAALPMLGLLRVRPLALLGAKGRTIAGLVLVSIPLIVANILALLLYEPPPEY